MRSVIDGSVTLDTAPIQSHPYFFFLARSRYDMYVMCGWHEVPSDVSWRRAGFLSFFVTGGVVGCRVVGTGG